ncbi:MAG: hypothetical protein ABI395_09715 [Sphingobium sp.]
MKHYLALLSAAALLTLSACGDNQPEVVGNTPDPLGDQLKNAAPVALPPMVKGSRTYRCKDSGLIFVDFMSDDTTANIRLTKDGAPTKLTAEAAGKPFKAEGGYEVSGTGDVVTAAVPGKEAQSCKS